MPSGGYGCWQPLYVDCSDFKMIYKERFTSLFGKDTIKGTIDTYDLKMIKEAIASYQNASPKILKRFGLK